MSKDHSAKKYKEEFIKLLRCPRVAHVLQDGDFIPFELGERKTIRYKRTEEDVDAFLRTEEGEKIAVFCLEEKIQKAELLNYAGGDFGLYIKALQDRRRCRFQELRDLRTGF